MEITELYDITYVDGMLITTVKHVLTLETIKMLIDYQIETNTYKYRVFDFNGYTPAEITASDVKDIAEYDRVYPERSYAAIIADGLLSFGIMRMFTAYRDNDKYGEIEIFRNRSKAIEWIKQKQLENN